MKIFSRKTEYRKAFVLVGVMWIIILLTLIVTVVAQSSMIDMRITHIAAERMRCKWVSRAGLEKAIAILNDDKNDDEIASGSDSLYDIWSNNVADFNSVPLDQCFFNVIVVDESSKLNINTATRDQLLYIPDMTEDIADSIIDWRDGDDEISEAGAESGYYLNLPFAYETRNGDFKTVRELLLVREVTKGLFFGDQTLDENVSELNQGWIKYFTCYSRDLNKDAEGNDRINVNSADENTLTEKLSIGSAHAKWIVENRQFNSIADLVANNSPSQPQGNVNGDQALPLDLQTFYEIIDKVSVSDDESVPGRVNVNTAGEDVLIALFEGDQQVASDIISFREGREEGLVSLGDLKDIKSINIELAKKFIGSVTTRSSVFTVHSTATGQATKISRKIEAVVDRGKSPTEILYYRDGAVN